MTLNKNKTKISSRQQCLINQMKSRDPREQGGGGNSLDGHPPCNFSAIFQLFRRINRSRKNK